MTVYSPNTGVRLLFNNIYLMYGTINDYIYYFQLNLTINYFLDLPAAFQKLQKNGC